ncbi:MAG: YfiR family protein [Planctomycetes bacterium]|nr:YfiR family protein [Planctomycetota bacterium]
MNRATDNGRLRGASSRWRALLAGSVLALFVLAVAPPLQSAEVRATAEPGTAEEYALKAAFLYNFARYTKWPESAFKDAESPIVIGVFGADPFGSTLDKALDGKSAGKRKFVIQRFESIEKLTAVHVLFVPFGEEKQLEKLRTKYLDKPVMLVAETLAAAEQGAQVGFYFEKSKVRFAINSTAMKAAKLEVSSELLKLAKIVETPAKEARQ